MVVTPPCSSDSMKSMVRWRGVKSPNTGCTCESIRPGKAVAPRASMTISASSSRPRPMALIRPSSARIESASRSGASTSPDAIAPRPVISVRMLRASAQAVFADHVLRPETADPGVGPAAVGHREREQQLVGPGASGTRISIASKWERTSIALMWWTGMSRVAPSPPRFLTDGRMDTPPTRARAGARRTSDGARPRHARVHRARRRCRPCRRPRPASPSASWQRHGARRPGSRRGRSAPRGPPDQGPAYGLDTMAATATLRRGLSRARPPSDRMSSTKVTHFRISTAKVPHPFRAARDGVTRGRQDARDRSLSAPMRAAPVWCVAYAVRTGGITRPQRDQGTRSRVGRPVPS